MKLLAKKYDGSEEIDGYINIPNFLDTCPKCERAAELKPVYTFGHSKKIGKNDTIQVVMQCPRSTCRAFSIVTYRSHYQDFRGTNELTDYYPRSAKTRDFPQTIADISPEFIEIYKQSLLAEGSGLNKIAGVGYRKALEFLIKDYLVDEYPDRDEEIKKKALGKCIDEDVTNSNIKLVAKRATWIGNDETHYTRVWIDKDLNDLKMLIDLTVHWLDSEALTKKLINDMPDNPKPKINSKEIQNNK